MYNKNYTNKPQTYPHVIPFQKAFVLSDNQHAHTFLAITKK